MEPRTELLRVDESFHIQGYGLVVHPDFSVPNGWKNQVETVVVEKPDGQRYESIAQFNAVHFNVAFDSTDVMGAIDRRWRVIALLPNTAKDDLPAGSKIFVSRELRDKLHSVQAIENSEE
jgi:hypothetical protein